ncbi:MAG: NmrA/HSCARG family protein [Acidobacteriota bacterium]|nr:NmrA/HSCARG family protein [Acidobacteriota bacterium]
MTKPTIAVFGASGSQGGSVVRRLAELGTYHVRALTRRPEKYSGPADEAVFADLDDETATRAALEGAQGVFLVTNFWQPGTNETKQAGAAIRAAAEAGIDHFIWSSLPNVHDISGGKWHVPHFTDKARMDTQVREAGFPKYTIVQPPFYFENLIGNMAPSPMDDGRKGWTLPIDPEAKVIHMGSIEEFGSLVAGAFANPGESAGETLSMAAGLYDFATVVKTFSMVLGEPFGFKQVPREVFADFYPQADELGQMLGYFEEHTYMGPGAESRIAKAHRLAIKPFTPLEAWLAAKHPKTNHPRGKE